MTDTQPKVSSAEKVQDTPLTIREHLDPDKHWIGETLAPPTQGEIEATIGAAAGPGESPFVARADHKHKLDPGFYPAYIGVTNTGTISATTSTSFITWLITGSFTVPTWATKAVIQINMTGIYSVTAVSAYALDATISTSPAGYVSDYAIFSTGDTFRNSLSFCRQVSGFGIGTQDVRIGARRASGSGVLTFDASSRVNAFVIFGA